MVMAVREAQSVEDGHPDPVRTSNTGAGKPDTEALMLPWGFPSRKIVISCPGATIVDGYRYPIPAMLFTAASWPNAPGRNAAYRVISIRESFMTRKTSCAESPFPRFFIHWPEFPFCRRHIDCTFSRLVIGLTALTALQVDPREKYPDE